MVLRSLGPVFMFYTPELILIGTEGIRSSFHILSARTRFGVPRALGPFFMFCAHGPIFGESESVGSIFHVLGSQT
jgi:hypothetical protein